METVPMVQVVRGSTLREPEPQEVLITASLHRTGAAASVMIGTEHLGVTPYFLRRPPGRYAMTLRAPGQPPAHVEVAVCAERGAHIDVALGIDPLR